MNNKMTTPQVYAGRLGHNINPFHYIFQQNDKWYIVPLPRYRWSCYMNIVHICTYENMSILKSVIRNPR